MLKKRSVVVLGNIFIFIETGIIYTCHNVLENRNNGEPEIEINIELIVPKKV